MYTEIYVNVDLKADTPKEVLDVLTAMCAKDSDSPHLADKPDRWWYMFNNGSYYTPLTACALLTHDEIGGNWSLLAKGDIKNYEGEIEAFFAWIMPYVDAEQGEFIGYSRYEEDQLPTLVVKQGESTCTQ
jgi:hypothetical protein